MFFSIQKQNQNYMNNKDENESCDMDMTTTIIVIILVLSIIYYLMNLFGMKIGNTKTNWLVIIALIVCAVYLYFN